VAEDADKNIPFLYPVTYAAVCALRAVLDKAEAETYQVLKKCVFHNVAKWFYHPKNIG